MKNLVRRILAVAVCCGIALVHISTVRAEPAEKLFAKHCVSCHGKDGKAQSPAARKLGVKDLSISKVTDVEIEKQLQEGKKDDRGNQKMPPFKDKLSRDEIKSLIVLVKTFRK
jgi:mono/diheme cytochrome c family protein